MDFAMQYLWAAGYDLPPETSPQPETQAPKRRGKKAARVKREKAGK